MTLFGCFVALSCLFCSVVGAQGRTLEQRALERVLEGGLEAREIVRDFRFFNAESARALSTLAIEQLMTGQRDPFVFNLIWAAVAAVERSTLPASEKDHLLQEVLDALRSLKEIDTDLVAEVIEHRLGRSKVTEIDFGNLSREDQMLFVQKLEVATFLIEMFQTAQPNYDASVDFWNYQKVLRERLGAWRPDGFNAPVVTLFDPFGRSGFGFRGGNYAPVLPPPEPGEDFKPGPLGPENVVLRATLVNGTRISSPDVNPARAQARARLHFLAGILADSKVVLPPTQLDARGGPAPVMNWQIDTYADSGRCNSRVNSLRSEGIENYNFGYTCNYSGGDSTPTETVGAISVGTDRFGVAGEGRGYWALAASFARGGFADRGDENQTASLNYTVHGKATLAKCNSPLHCAPIVEVRAEVPSRSYPGFDLNPPPKARYTLLVDGAALPLGETVVIDRSAKDVDIEIILQRSFTHVGACCYPGRGQSRAKLVVPQAGTAELGLMGVGNDDAFSAPSPVAGPMPPGVPFGSQDLNRMQMENLVDLLRAVSGFNYIPDLKSPFYSAVETRKSAFLGQKASGGFFDDLSSILTALYLIHDFQAHRPDDVPPYVTTLLRLLQGTLSNRARREFKPALAEAIRFRQQQLQLLGSSLFSQTLAEARELLIGNAIERDKVIVLLREIAPLLDDPNLVQLTARQLRGEINAFEANSTDNTLALLTRLDGFTSEMAAIRARLASEVDALVKIQAQF